MGSGLGHSSGRPPWHAWYKTARWQALRSRVFLRDLFTCRKCGVLIQHPPDRVADHIEPHRGNPALFWSEENVATLCKPCHDRVKQAEEQATKHQRGTWH